MKKFSLNRALTLFNVFKSYKLTANDLHKADKKAIHLDDKVSDFKLLLSMLKDVTAGQYKMNKWNLSIIIGTIVYVISPLDAMPDFLPFVGWLDDVTIVGYALSKLSEEISKYKDFMHKSTKVVNIK